jgi:hypothetical protein
MELFVLALPRRRLKKPIIRLTTMRFKLLCARNVEKIDEKIDPLLMKKTNRFALAALLAGLMCFATSPAQALTEKEVSAINKTIKEAPAADLPVKAAELVTQSAKKEKEAVAVAVVRAAIAKKPASAVSVVSSVVKAAPFTAPAVAAAAAKLAPDQVEAIATAAALAASEIADKIVAAIADVYPNLEERVAKAVMLAVPQAQAKIRQRSSGNSQAGIGETYSRTGTKIDGSSFPASPPPAAYANPGKDPGHN